jgi:hypothetical protein
LLAPTAEPLIPNSPRLFGKQKQTAKVAANAEIVEVTLDAPRERGVLLLDRKVSMATTPVGDGLN